MSFEEFPKIARLSRECTITEKIDGTNAHLVIATQAELSEEEQALARVVDWAGSAVYLLPGSRNRYITPSSDNFGFARWAWEHAEELVEGLGYGRHYGEWWGSGIQRGYGQTRKRFSLFNTSRWGLARPACCDVVPTLYLGLFTTGAVEMALERLRTDGSAAAPGFMKPEGVVVWHGAARVYFKKTLEKDEGGKGRE